MARRKIGNESVRAINKLKKTYYISIPIGVIRKFKWKNKQKVTVKPYGKNKLLISDWKKGK